MDEENNPFSNLQISFVQDDEELKRIHDLLEAPVNTLNRYEIEDCLLCSLEIISGLNNLVKTQEQQKEEYKNIIAHLYSENMDSDREKKCLVEQLNGVEKEKFSMLKQVIDCEKQTEKVIKELSLIKKEVEILKNKKWWEVLIQGIKNEKHFFGRSNKIC
jgi:septal ring factor EnvC (AmiA/AmiB activator)